MRIKVRWEVSDGYVGSRPYDVHVDADDFQHCETDGDIEQLLAEIVQEDFERRVSFSIRNESEVIAQIKAELAKESP